MINNPKDLSKEIVSEKPSFSFIEAVKRVFPEVVGSDVDFDFSIFDKKHTEMGDDFVQIMKEHRNYDSWGDWLVSIANCEVKSPMPSDGYECIAPATYKAIRSVEDKESAMLRLMIGVYEVLNNSDPRKLICLASVIKGIGFWLSEVLKYQSLSNCAPFLDVLHQCESDRLLSLRREELESFVIESSSNKTWGHMSGLILISALSLLPEDRQEEVHLALSKCSRSEKPALWEAVDNSFRFKTPDQSCLGTRNELFKLLLSDKSNDFDIE